MIIESDKKGEGKTPRQCNLTEDDEQEGDRNDE